MSDEIAIKVDGVSKTFRLPHEKQSSLKSALINFKKLGYEKQQVLDDISFEVKKGEFFGIVGRNGSGKSTLLKLMAGIYSPSAGAIQVNGKLTPFIELGVGFNFELTGRENVYLNGALLGFSRKEMHAMYADIVDFAELGRFMDQKLKNYSSGMQVRLAFSIAIRANGDILLLDEVLAVGDEAFQQKCYDYFADLKRANRTVLLVSHSMPSVERFCDRALLLESGKIVDIGRSDKIAGLYQDLFLDDENKKDLNKVNDDSLKKNLKVSLQVSQHGKKINAVKALQDFTFNIEIDSEIEVKNANIGINIRNNQGIVVFSTDTIKSIGGVHIKPGQKKSIDITMSNYYTNGKYTVDFAVVNEESVSDKIIFRQRRINEFKIMGITDHAHSQFHPPFNIKV